MNSLCSICQLPFNCDANAANCWCQALPSLPRSAYQDRSCLCANCLNAELHKGVVLYGIANCDTVKKARTWLAEQGVEYTFWDFKKHGVPETELDNWLAGLGWQALTNTRGTTWRGLAGAVKASVIDTASAKTVLLANPSVIKRPVVNWAERGYTLGFDAAAWVARRAILASTNQ